jgi:hypothetical protein
MMIAAITLSTKAAAMAWDRNCSQVSLIIGVLRPDWGASGRALPHIGEQEVL